MSTIPKRPRRIARAARAAAAAALAAPAATSAAPFTTAYTDGGTWNTVYAQGFSPAVAPNPEPGVTAGDPVLLDAFQFFKSGNADSASDIRLIILDNLFANLQGLTTSSAAVIGLSTKTVAETASIATGAPITFDFDYLDLIHGNSYGAMFANVGPNGELTPVLVSALTANYTEVTPGDWHPQTNYGSETDWPLSTSNFINSGAGGDYFHGFSYGGDANFVASLVTPNTWNAAGGGNWSISGNWLGEVPNAAGAPAIFGGAATGPATVTADLAVTAGGIVFDNAANSYTIDGSNAVTLDVSAGAASIRVRSGSHTIAAPLQLADDTLITVTPAASVLTLSNLRPSAVYLTKAGAGTVIVNNLRASGLAVTEGVVRVAPDAGDVGASNIGSVSITGTGQLDLTDNKLITDTPAGTATAGVYGGVQGLVQSGYAGGAWSGPGIISSVAPTIPASEASTAIGIATGAQVNPALSTPGATALFAGQTITGSSTIAMYTYGGDANLDGLVSGDDYTAIDFAIAVPGASGWANGDFNLDGIISGDDYTVIDFNIAAQGAAFPTGDAGGISAVPEPAAALAVAATLALVMTGRRRRCESPPKPPSVAILQAWHAKSQAPRPKMV